MQADWVISIWLIDGLRINKLSGYLRIWQDKTYIVGWPAVIWSPVAVQFENQSRLVFKALGVKEYDYTSSFNPELLIFLNLLASFLLLLFAKALSVV